MSANEGAMIAQILSHGLLRPKAEALRCGAASLNWGEFRADVLSTAAVLKPIVDSGNGRIGLLGSASVELVVTYLGTIAAGGCAVLLPVSAHRDALAGMIADFDPALIIAHDDNAAMLDGITKARIEIVVPGQGMSAALTAAPLAEAMTVHADTDFNIIYSSGTTGRAKGIVHAHAMRHRQAARSIFGLDPTSTMLLATPLYSNTTLMPMLAALFHGGRVILMSKFDVSTYLDIAETERATHTMLVPVQYQRIIEAPDFSRRDLSAFKVKQSTGAPLTSAIKRRIVDEWPGEFFEVYGLTEGGCTAILDASVHPDKAHTVGKPAGGNDIRIIDEAGNFLGNGERGEIVGRSATMMSGYLNNAEANRAFYWRDSAGNLYHRTGDLGMFDADGFLVLLDRKKDMIISGGFNIYASDLEEQLLSHPLVADAAVIAIPSDKWGETPLGLVVAKGGAALDPAEILDWANARVGKMQRLSGIELRDALPRSNVGKVLKQDLRRPYWEKRA